MSTCKKTIPFMRAYTIWLGGEPPNHPFYYIIDRIKKDPTAIFTFIDDTLMVRCDVGLVCVNERWYVNRKLFEKAVKNRESKKVNYVQTK